MQFHYGFDTSTYFQAAATDLIRSHGEDALLLAEHALHKMRMSGDAEGVFLWEGVRSAIFDTIVDALDDGVMPARPSSIASAGLCH
jgi:hypothetical protein